MFAPRQVYVSILLIFLDVGVSRPYEVIWFRFRDLGFSGKEVRVSKVGFVEGL
jgi:hypothetical protein